MPINAAVVRALAEGPRSLADLRGAAGLPPHTTMRDYLRVLTRTGVVEKHRSETFPGAVGYELTTAGNGLLEVALLLAAWLAAAPGRPIELGRPEAKNATKALVDGWTSSMVRALAARPLSLTELDSVISNLNYPSLERRLAVMRQLGMVEAVPSRGRGTPYTVTDWLRRAIAPLAAATRWEHRHLRNQAPAVTNRDIEAAFLLAIPLLRLSAAASGFCRVAVQVDNGDLNSLVGAMVEVREGRIASCLTRLEGHPHARALGSTSAWFEAVTACDASRLELGGDLGLATELLEGLHAALFNRDARRQRPSAALSQPS